MNTATYNKDFHRTVKKAEIPTCNILGVDIAAIDMEWLLTYLNNNIKALAGDYICVSNVHTTVTAYEEEAYRKVQNGGIMAIPDGGPLSSVGQKRGFKNMKRTTGPSLMGEIFKISASKGYRHYFYGSTDETLEKLYSVLMETYPGIQIAGMYSPPFRPMTEEEDQLEDTIEKNKFEWENIAKSKSILTKYGKMIFVRDMWKQWYINGINQKIDSVEKVIEFLRTETENMRVTTVGNSSGGYMATLVAQKLNAKMAYCVSGQFDIVDQISRQPVVRKAAEENYKYINIVRTITSTTVIYLYPALCEWDKQQADLVNNNNFVISIPFSNSKHGETCYGFNFPYILTCDKQIFEHLMKNAPMGGYSKRIFLFRTVGWFRGMKLLIVNFISKSRKKLG